MNKSKNFTVLTKTDKMLLSSINDRMQRCSEKYMITFSNFLDLRQRFLISSALSFDPSKPDDKITLDSDITFGFYGGYPDAERSILVFLPSYIGSCVDKYFFEDPESNPIEIIRASFPKGSQVPTHRDYLGALMNLGIKREMIGDIIPHENSADFIVLKDISEFIRLNMLKAAHTNLSCEILPISEIRKQELKRKEIRTSISSPRLDSLVASAFGISRTKAHEAISSGIVYVNDIQTEKPEKLIEAGSKLVLRGRGKAMFRSVEGKSSKGRMIIKIERFL